MGLFRRKSKETSAPTNPYRDELIQLSSDYLSNALQEAGFGTKHVVTERGHGIEIENTGHLGLENLADLLEQTPPDEHEGILQHWFSSIMESIRGTDVSSLKREDVVQMIRSRVIASDDSANQEYARPVAEGLVEVLCLDYPDRIAYVDNGWLPDLDLSIDELFEQGRLNTKNEPIDKLEEKDGLSVAYGESSFIASKIVDIPAFLAQVGMEAPNGLLFSVPEKSIVVFKPATDIADLHGVSSATRNLLLSLYGVPVSHEVFYWSPNGTIEAVSQTIPSESGDPSEDTVMLTPSDEFTSRVTQK